MKWYFTFGVGDKKHKNNYVCINGTNEEARTKMFERFGSNWAFDYSEAEWVINKGTKQWDTFVEHGVISPNEPSNSLTQAEIFNLTELKL